MKTITTFDHEPLCSDRETYSQWRELAIRERPGRAGFCSDCTPAYQAKMIDERRCKYPDVRFMMKDGFLEGYLP